MGCTPTAAGCGVRLAVALVVTGGCGGDPSVGADAGSPVEGGAACPGRGVHGSGTHRLFVQGHDAPANPDGTWPLLHDEALCDDTVFVDDANGNGKWDLGEEPHPLGPSAIVHGEHFLVGPGSFVELTHTLCADITGNVTFYIPNYDEAGSEALHELFVVHDGVETLVASAVDAEPGSSGYNPFVRVIAGDDPLAEPGDTLLLRSTNLSGVPFSVMVWQPPSEYESWILVEVP